MEKAVETTGAPARVELTADRETIEADGRDVAVVTVRVFDGKGRFVPDADVDLSLSASGPLRILGVGNGDPTFKAKERPADGMGREFKVKTFNGLAQVLLQSDGEPGAGILTVDGVGLPSKAIGITLR